MLPEGANRKIVCRSWRMDEKDFFGLLLKIATHDTIGAITVKEVNHKRIKSLPIHPCRLDFERFGELIGLKKKRIEMILDSFSMRT